MRRVLPIVAAGVGSGVLTILPFPDLGWWVVAPIALVPLLVAVPSLGLRGALLTGWITGAVSLAGIFHWIVPTAVNLAQFPTWAAALVLGAYAIVYGLNGAAMAVALRTILRLPLPAWAAVLLAPAAVVAVDFVGPHLFPFTLGNTYWRVPLLIQGADVTGIEGATYVTVAVSTAIALALRDLWARRRPSLLPGGVAIVLLAAWLAYGAVRLQSVREDEAAAPVLRLLLVQPDARPDERRSRDPKVRDGLVDRLIAMSRTADRTGVDAVIWPEGAFPYEWVATTGAGAVTYQVRAARLVKEMVREVGIPLVFGAITRPDERGRNSMLMLGPDGEEANRYDKRLLLAFGEYMPLSDTFPWLKGRVPGVGNLREGEAFGAFTIAGHVAAPSVCYEAVQAGLTREAVVAVDAGLILNVTNDGWFGTSGAPRQHLMDQVPRAVELRRPVVRATMTGISAVVRASGDLVGETGVYERATVVVEVPVPTDPERTVFAVVGRAFAWACFAATVAALFAALVAYRKGKKSRSTTTG
jgi:apolipoprotein N-acyltransferase